MSLLDQAKAAAEKRQWGTPTARKSFGEYKPMLKHASGRTEILGQDGHVEHIRPQTKFYSGPTEVYHARRGITFPTRIEAIAYAEKIIACRRTDLIRRLIEPRHRALREQHGLPREI